MLVHRRRDARILHGQSKRIHGDAAHFTRRPFSRSVTPPSSLLLGRFASNGVEKEFSSSRSPEIEHVHQRPSTFIERLIANPPEVPDVFNKAQYRSLIGNAVIHEIDLGPRRDHKKRNAGTISAAALIRTGSCRSTTAGPGQPRPPPRDRTAEKARLAISLKVNPVEAA